MSKVYRGFQRLNPLVVNSEISSGKLKAASHTFLDKYKEKLANKVINSKTLTPSEKEDIYRYLTDKEPPCIIGKGRPSTVGRDIKIAMDFLDLRKTILNTKELMDTLREYDERRVKYNKANVSYKEITDNAIYSAVDRGVEAIIKLNAIQFAIDYENGFLCDLSDNDEDLKKQANYTRELYSLIEEYINQKRLRRKHK